jgi:hypothetical protein
VLLQRLLSHRTRQRRQQIANADVDEITNPVGSPAEIKESHFPPPSREKHASVSLIYARQTSNKLRTRLAIFNPSPRRGRRDWQI